MGNLTPDFSVLVDLKNVQKQQHMQYTVPGPYLEEHGAVLVGVGRLNVVGRAGVAPANGPHHDPISRLPLQAPRQAAAARAELLRWRLLEARVLQDAFWEGSPQAALTAAAGQAFACKRANKRAAR